MEDLSVSHKSFGLPQVGICCIDESSNFPWCNFVICSFDDEGQYFAGSEWQEQGVYFRRLW